jgi:U3 small nucleolar RNA-associated protein 10
MSALAKQLDRIRGETARTKAKGRASILFHHREAEDVDAETIFGMASNAMVLLCKSDHRLAPYVETLFSGTAKTFDRDMATPDENAAADASVNAFLATLSAYVNQPAGQKCLEWLIRRFRCAIFHAS